MTITTTNEEGGKICFLNCFVATNITIFKNYSNFEQIQEKKFVPSDQCCVSMTFWCGSGSGSAGFMTLCKMDPDPDIFMVNLFIEPKILCTY